MEMINTQTITRDEAIARIKYILGLIQLEFLDELGDTIDFDSGDLNMDDVDSMLGNIMDEPLFRFSRFDNYIIEN